MRLPGSGGPRESATTLAQNTGNGEYGGGSPNSTISQRRPQRNGAPERTSTGPSTPVNTSSTGNDFGSIEHQRNTEVQQNLINPLDDLDPNDPFALELEDGQDQNITLRDRQQEMPRHSSNPPQNRLSAKNTKASLKIATLNIRGFRSAGAARNETKWNHVNQVVRDQKISILLVQETHLTEERRDDIEKLFGKRLKILFSADQVNPTGKGGVAVVLNKNLINTQGANVTEIIPGRAILVSINWHREEIINILNIYAPNVTEYDGQENGTFWTNLNNYFIRNPRVRVDVLAGDCNMVEDAQDRIPARLDPHEATEALDTLKQTLYLKDAWRDAFPDKRTATFFQDTTASMSRIDRIYMLDTIALSAREWVIAPSGIPGTDHHITSVRISHADAPLVGRGRWTLKKHVMRDEKFRSYAIKTGAKALEEIKTLNGCRTDNYNAQTIYKSWKEGILEMARNRDKTIIPKCQTEKRSLELERDRILADSNLDGDDKRDQLIRATKNLDRVEKKIHLLQRERIAIKNRLEGETLCKFWTRSNKQASPRDMIFALKKENPPPNSPQFETNSVKMAELARNYHKKLQDQCRNVPDALREEKIRKVLNSIQTRTTDTQYADLSKTIQLKELLKSLKDANNSSAPGPDGIPYEFWKSMDGQYTNDARLNLQRDSQRTTCNVMELLRLNCEDIQSFGISKKSSFADGWMCPLYKKNERTDIANYRPITCLNTDYKLFTKSLATRLSGAIRYLVHPSQAGFIPGRSITEQTKLIRMMIHYAEAKEENGLIVALDQEKAYDKIDHEYLWRTLEQFGIPHQFINTVKALYNNAFTRVMINGIMSSPWKITRGVRQGDPLSCLLFDLAIEPLAASLRESGLKGYSLPGQAEKLIANLFADDTTTFLSIDDDLEALNPILEEWCIASKANFNISKTEIIPIGTLDFRERVLRERRTKPEGPIIPNSIHIVEEGTSIRILGAWFGNGADLSTPWTNVLEKIDKSLTSWEKSNPTMEGRRLIVQMVIAGMTQYLAQVQGIPEHIERALSRRAIKFMWAGKSSLVNEQTMFRPFVEGGRALVDIKSRDKAIGIMWLKSYLKFGPDCPLWAIVADELMAINVPKTEDKVDNRVKFNPFLQSWKSKVSTKGEICNDITQLFKTAKEFGVRPEGLAFRRVTLRNIPVWYHFAADPKLRRMNRGRISECLKSTHAIRLVGEAEALANSLVTLEHRNTDECECAGCMILEEKGCMHPHSCVTRAGEMLNTLPEKWNPRSVQPDDRLDPTGELDDNQFNPQETRFEARLATEDNVADIFRIFTTGNPCNQLYLPQNNSVIPAPTSAYIGGKNKRLHSGTGGCSMGAGVALEDDEETNYSEKWLCLESDPGIGGTLLAVLLTSLKVGLQKHIKFSSRSGDTIESLTTDLTYKEDAGFIGTRNAGLLRIVIGRLRMHLAPITFSDISGTQVSPIENRALSLAKEALNKTRPMSLPPIPIELHLTGAKLSKITQSIAYKSIRKMINPPERPRTTAMVNAIVEKLRSIDGKTFTTTQFWSSLRNKDFSKPIRIFLWKCAHDAYKIGSYWDRPSMKPDLKLRTNCTHDGVVESMSHILTECHCPGQETVWGLVNEVWLKKTKKTLPAQSVSTILGSALTMIRDDDGRPSQGRTRLYRIIITEAAHLIWALRCERVIQNNNVPHTEIEIANRWNKILKNRAELDVKLTSKKLGKKSLDELLVRSTWEYTGAVDLLPLEEPRTATQGGVLVGSGPNSRVGVG